MTRRVNLPVKVSGLEVVLVCLVKIPAVVLSVLFCLPVQTCSIYTRLKATGFPSQTGSGTVFIVALTM